MPTAPIDQSFDSSYTETQIEKICALRIKAGAVSSTYKKKGEGWIVTTVWPGIIKKTK